MADEVVHMSGKEAEKLEKEALTGRELAKKVGYDLLRGPDFAKGSNAAWMSIAGGGVLWLVAKSKWVTGLKVVQDHWWAPGIAFLIVGWALWTGTFLWKGRPNAWGLIMMSTGALLLLDAYTERRAKVSAMQAAATANGGVAPGTLPTAGFDEAGNPMFGWSTPMTGNSAQDAIREAMKAA
jgi:hypothetical protein